MVLNGLRGIARRRMSGEFEEDEEKDEFLEVNVMDETTHTGGKVGIRIEHLTEFADTEKVLKALREGSVVFLKIKNLKEKDLGELKRAVERLKKTVMAQNGDIAGVEQDWLILAPEHATVQRE
jgi:SepF-like predicted cell division protein (DUF552 family)